MRSEVSEGKRTEDKCVEFLKRDKLFIYVEWNVQLVFYLFWLKIIMLGELASSYCIVVF